MKGVISEYILTVDKAPPEVSLGETARLGQLGTSNPEGEPTDPLLFLGLAISGTGPDCVAVELEECGGFLGRGW